jgi:hypothetical protein
MSGAQTATRKKRSTTTADTTPVRSRRKRNHVSRPGARPAGTGAGPGAPGVEAEAGRVIVRGLPGTIRETPVAENDGDRYGENQWLGE